MVDKNHSAGDRYGQFIDLPLEAIALEASQPLVNRAMVSRDYADADIIHLAAFIRNNPNPVLVFSPDGEVIKTNPAAVHLLKRLQIEPLAILPAEHLQIVATCLEGQRDEYTTEVSVNNIYLALTYRSLSAFKIVYLYAIELTDYRQAEAELLQVASKTIDLAKQAVSQLQAFRKTLPKASASTVAVSQAKASDQPSLDDMFVSMDGCVFASAMGGKE
jgi:PAS domain-containing protein